MRRIALDVGEVLVHVDFKDFFAEFKRLGLKEDPFVFICDIQARQDIGIKTLRVSLRSKFGLIESQIESLMKAWNRSIQPDDDILDFVDGLKKSGVKVAILSNMGFEHTAYIREEYPRIFDGCELHLSCEVGARKPSKLYYQSFLMQHPKFNGCLFLDDRPENLVVAEKFGLIGRHFELSKFNALTFREQGNVLRTIKDDIERLSKENVLRTI